MGLGYEGWVKIDDMWALGTGASFPRARVRLESASGYGGQINDPPKEIGIGSPYNYDYGVYDGNINFELNLGLVSVIIDSFIFDRQGKHEVSFSAEHGTIQELHDSVWSSITISGDAETIIDCSVSFVSLTGGASNLGIPIDLEASKTGNPENTPLCDDANFPRPLNNDQSNENPIPGWDVEIKANGDKIDFITWSLAFNQDVIKFFACEANTDVQEPKYIAVGPLSVVFSGTFINHDVLDDELDLISLKISPNSGFSRILKMKRCEKNTEQEDLQQAGSLTTLDTEYNVYELEG